MLLIDLLPPHGPVELELLESPGEVALRGSDADVEYVRAMLAGTAGCYGHLPAELEAITAKELEHRLTAAFGSSSYRVRRGKAELRRGQQAVAELPPTVMI